MRQLLNSFVADTTGLLRESARRFREKRVLLLVIGAVGLGAAAAVHPFDAAWSRAIAAPQSEGLTAAARALSFWGDYQTGSLILWAALWFGLRRNRRWRLAGAACLLAATLAGLSANAVKWTTGRPRPYAEMPDKFYGPGLEKRLAGFPSGHASTSMGTAAALATAVPALGAPALVGASAVVWSRMYLRRHYPSDVIVGSTLGILFGLVLGLAARRLCRPAPEA